MVFRGASATETVICELLKLPVLEAPLVAGFPLSATIRGPGVPEADAEAANAPVIAVTASPSTAIPTPLMGR